jgi:N-acetylglutamate synthase-like GNAT family acetyltransferase
MSRRIRELQRLDDLPASCRQCVFWEAPGAVQGPAGPDGQAGKEAWWRAAELEWGVPGRGAYVDDACAGYVTYGPPDLFPRVRAAGKTPSEDALLLATLWVAPGHRQGSVGRALLDAVLREAGKRGLRAVEAMATRVGEPSPWRCLVPERFLTDHGFTVLQDDPLHPLLRLDLRQTVRWQEQVGQALESVVSVLRPKERLPHPAPGGGGLARAKRLSAGRAFRNSG